MFQTTTYLRTCLSKKYCYIKINYINYNIVTVQMVLNCSSMNCESYRTNLYKLLTIVYKFISSLKFFKIHKWGKVWE